MFRGMQCCLIQAFKWRKIPTNGLLGYVLETMIFSLFWQFQVWLADSLLFRWLTAIVLAECLQGTGSAKSGVRNCSKCKVAGTTIRRRQSPLRRVNGRTGKMHRGWFAQLRCSSDVLLQSPPKIVGSSKSSFWNTQRQNPYHRNTGARSSQGFRGTVVTLFLAVLEKITE